MDVKEKVFEIIAASYLRMSTGQNSNFIMRMESLLVFTSGDFFAGKISGNKRLTIGYDCGILTITY